MPTSDNIRYKVDFDYLSTLLLPSLLRKPKLRAWLGALLAPLRLLYTTFLLYAEATRIELGYNSQTIVLEAALNDQFDTDLRRIRIDNSDVEIQPLYVNFKGEQQADPFLRFAAECPPWTYCYSYAAFSALTDFTVRVPVQLRTPQRTNQLNARIRHFKLATRHYRLLFV
jgi:hypothetical protein